jgi:hypothetical protein
MTCPNCERWAELFARAAASATESGALVRSLLKTLNDVEINRQVALAEKMLAEATPLSKYVN